MFKEQRAFTLVEVIIAISLISIITSIGLPKVNDYLNYLKLKNVTNMLVSDLYWAQQQAIMQKIKHGIIFYKDLNKYEVVKDKTDYEIIKEVDLTEEGIRIGGLSFPDYNDAQGVFFKILGNLDEHNGSVELISNNLSRKITFSSNAGELNIN